MNTFFIILILYEVLASALGELNFISIKSHKSNSNEIFRNYNKKIKFKNHVGIEKEKFKSKIYRLKFLINKIIFNFIRTLYK
jgi:hypothetical protein